MEAISIFKEGAEKFTPQSDSFTYAEKITKADCLIDFSRDAVTVHNQIRGLSPVPVAFTKTQDGKVLKVVRAHIVSKDKECEMGTVVSLEGGICIACGRGVIALDEIVPEGKGKMTAAAYINGRKINVGDKLG